MSRFNISIAVFGLGLAALGFALGQFYEDRREKPGWQPPPPPPKYTAQATFEMDDPFKGTNAAPLVVPEGSLTEILQDENDLRRASRLAALLLTRGPEDVPEVAAALTDGVALMECTDVTLLIGFWAMHEPDEASRFAFHEPRLGCRVPAMTAAIETWAAIDAPAAAAATKEIGFAPNLDTTDVDRALVEGWFDSGQPGLEGYIRDLGLTQARQQNLGYFFFHAVRRDGPTAAGRWAEAIPDEDRKFKIDAFRQLASVLTARNVPDGIAWCEAHCEGRFGGALRMIVAQLYARSDPMAAMTWVSQAPAGVERDSAVMAVSRTWAAIDLEGFHEFVEGVGPDGIEPWLAPATTIIAMSYSTTEPTAGMKWAEQIEDQPMRHQALAALANRWRLEDAEAAEAWIEASSLPPEHKERALGSGPG